MEVVYFLLSLTAIVGLLIMIAVVRDLQERVQDLEMQNYRRKNFKDML